MHSGSATTNVTHVGAGTSSTSHTDLRFNYLVGVRNGIQSAATANGLRVPDEGDLAAIEFLDGVRLRITFITDPTSIANLTPLLDQRGGAWGWLPPAIVGSWDDEVDA